MDLEPPGTAAGKAACVPFHRRPVHWQIRCAVAIDVSSQAPWLTWVCSSNGAQLMSKPMTVGLTYGRLECNLAPAWPGRNAGKMHSALLNETGAFCKFHSAAQLTGCDTFLLDDLPDDDDDEDSLGTLTSSPPGFRVVSLCTCQSTHQEAKIYWQQQSAILAEGNGRANMHNKIIPNFMVALSSVHFVCATLLVVLYQLPQVLVPTPHFPLTCGRQGLQLKPPKAQSPAGQTGCPLFPAAPAPHVAIPMSKSAPPC